MKYKYIIWDWNGTLYDDVQIGIDAMNQMLELKGYKTRLTLERYREIFCFPIIEYYRRIGFDFGIHPFEELAELYISLYCKLQDRAELYPQSEGVLNKIGSAGAVQAVISACEKNRLAQQINQFGIMKYFSGAVGIDDNLAAGKAELAKKWLDDNKIPADKVVFIGDTVHDFEVAEYVGCDSILVAGGHQNYERLKNTGASVAESLNEIVRFL